MTEVDEVVATVTARCVACNMNFLTAFLVNSGRDGAAQAFSTVRRMLVRHAVVAHGAKLPFPQKETP